MNPNEQRVKSYASPQAQIYSALALILHNKWIKNSWVIHEEINPKTCETLLEREENICTWIQLTTYFHVIHSLLINMILGLMKETIRNLNKKSKDLFSKFENCMSYYFFFFLWFISNPVSDDHNTRTSSVN